MIVPSQSWSYNPSFSERGSAVRIFHNRHVDISDGGCRCRRVGDRAVIPELHPACHASAMFEICRLDVRPSQICSIRNIGQPLIQRCRYRDVTYLFMISSEQGFRPQRIVRIALAARKKISLLALPGRQIGRASCRERV